MRNTRTFVLLSASILLFSGCAERGYQLTVQPSTHTAFAQTTTDLNANIPQKSTEAYDKMNQAVKKELRKTKKPIIQHMPSKPKPSIKSKKVKKQGLGKSLHDSIPIVRTPVRKKPVLNQEKEELSYQKEKKPTTSPIEKTGQEIQKTAHEVQRPSQEVKTPIQEKENTSIPQVGKQMSLEQEIALSLSRQTKKKAAGRAKENKAKENNPPSLQAGQTQVHEVKPSKSIPTPDVSAKTTKVSQISSVQKRSATEETKIAAKPRQENIYKPVPEKTSGSTSGSINFQHIGKTYYKFGTSEIHGHIIYLNKQGDEIPLKNVRVYLLPKNATLDHWYKTYYLKNKKPSKSITMGYIHKTNPDLEKNFGFYGVPAGKYYVIIVADNPNDQNKKIYIAKKLDIGKYKKIMAVFSKRL